MAEPETDGCSNPVRLLKRVTNFRTGQISETPAERRCGNRRASECPSCSKLYRGDAFQVIRSGLFDPSNPTAVYTWVTFTAPGADVFGPTHSQRRDKNKKIRPCACRQRHSDGDALIGTPLYPESYRYDLAADFNANAGRLAAVTFQKLSRMLNRKLQVVRVVEYQSRGLVHVHAIVRGVVTRRSLQVSVGGGINLRTGRRIAPATSGGWKWGPQCDSQVLNAGSGGRLVAYMVKVVGYALKAVSDETAASGTHSRRMERAGRRSCKCEHPQSLCRAGKAMRYPRRLTLADGSVVQMDVHIPYQADVPVYYCRRHQAARRGWGFRGHVLSVSRRWGLTFKEVRERRQQWRSGGMDPPDYLLVEWILLPRGFIASQSSP